MYIRYIQLSLLHYRIATKSDLLKMTIFSNDRCLYCKQKETLEHLLYKYVFLWIEVYQLNQDQVNWGRQLCDLENKSITLGKAKKKYKLIHIIIMATEMIIYSKQKKYLKITLETGKACYERPYSNRKVLGRNQQ